MASAQLPVAVGRLMRMADESTAHDQTVTRPCRLGRSLSALLILLRVCGINLCERRAVSSRASAIFQSVYSLVILVVNTAMVTSLLVLRTRLDSKTESDRLNAMTNICNRFVVTVGIHCSLGFFMVRCRAKLWSSVVHLEEMSSFNDQFYVTIRRLSILSVVLSVILVSGLG